MFDTHDFDPDAPQNLSAASNDALKRIIAHRGAVQLVRHLSALLAARDAHVTALTRLAEEYNVPKDRITETADRVKQAEQRRRSLNGAAAALFVPTDASNPSEPTGTADPPPETNGTGTGTIRGLTKLFGGAGTFKRKDSPKFGVASLNSASSSRSNSMPPPPAKNRKERPKSIDVQSMHSVNSADSVSWTTALFGAAGTIKGLSGGGNRRDSRSLREPREPVEMSTRHDEDQLPPTLSKPSLSQPAQSAHEAEWNKFLRRLMWTREQAGEEARSGELIGASTFGNEGAAGRQKQEALTRLVLGGIPMRFRHPIWMELSNTQAIMRPDAYKYYLNKDENEDPKEIDAILKDVPRTLTSKYDYYVEKGYDRLRRLLVAFVSKYPGLGYTQGLNMIAGYLLLAIPDESDAFWLLCNMVDDYFPPDYFARDAALTAPVSDNVVLRAYVADVLPKLADKLVALDIDAAHTVPLSWFLTAFASVLPESVLLRVWDVWLCLPHQKTFLFNVALALLTLHQKGLLECDGPGDYFAYMSNKMRVPEETARIDDFIRQAFVMRKKLEQVEMRRALEMRKLRKHASTEALYAPDPEAAHAGGEVGT
jgi:hypothetical protein